MEKEKENNCERLRLVDALGLTPSDKIRARYPNDNCLLYLSTRSLYIVDVPSFFLCSFSFSSSIESSLFLLQYYRSFSSPLTLGFYLFWNLVGFPSFSSFPRVPYWNIEQRHGSVVLVLR